MADKTSKQQAPGLVIWINGAPRVGKASVARELVQILGKESTIVLNAHDIRRSLLYDVSSKSFNYEAVVRREILKTIVAEPTETKTIICLGELTSQQVVFSGQGQVLTDRIFPKESLRDNHSHKQVALAYRTASRVVERPFRPVCLTVDPVELQRRGTKDCLSMEGDTKRAIWGPPTDGRTDWIKGTQEKLYRFSKQGIDIDTTNKSAKETAEAILRHVRDMEKGVTCEDSLNDEDWAIVSMDGSVPEAEEEVGEGWVAVTWS